MTGEIKNRYTFGFLSKKYEQLKKKRSLKCLYRMTFNYFILH